jgi:hypothetical protein
MRHARHAIATLAFAALGMGAAAGCSSDSKLKVYDYEPKEGDYKGGTQIDIKGNGFNSNGALGVKVYFGKGNDMRQATSPRFDGDGDLYVLAPGGKKGEKVDVVVQFEGKAPFKLPDPFTFVEERGADVNDLQEEQQKK